MIEIYDDISYMTKKNVKFLLERQAKREIITPKTEVLKKNKKETEKTKT